MSKGKKKGENKTQVNPKSETTLLVLVVDRSGSMESIREDMEGGIKALLEQQEAEPGRCLVTLAQFDTEYELLFNAVPVPELGDYHLLPRGGTALLDAIGRTIVEVDAGLAGVPEDRTPDVVFAVVTDGFENSSIEWTRDRVFAAVSERVHAGWNFTFIGADQDAIQEGERLGVSPDSSLTFGKSGVGTRAAMDSLSASVLRKRRRESETVSYSPEERRDSAS